MSLGINGNYFNIQNYLEMIEQINVKIINDQSNRINMTATEFTNKITNDWWITGEKAVEYNLADQVVNVFCHKYLFNTKDTITIESMFGEVDIHYYKCPVIHQPAKIESKIKDENVDYYMLLKYYIPKYAINELKNKNYVPSF